MKGSILSMTEVWNICEEITSKKNWYTKVFDPAIVNKWRSEIPMVGEHFDLAVGLLQATAQGSKHLPDCDWDEGSEICPSCEDWLKDDVLKHPQTYDLEDISPEEVKEFLESRDWNDLCCDWGRENCDHPKCSCTAPDHSLHNYIEYIPEGLLSSQLHQSLQVAIARMAAQEPIDWHPGSHEQVRDLIHPSMYCYVKGDEIAEVDRYQWLPSEFQVRDFKVRIVSYVNNLNSNKYPEMIPLLENTFEQFLPTLQKILKTPLGDLQVIVKIGQILLTPQNSQYKGGSWHLEGMPHEHIAATCIHYVDVKGITESFLEFRKPTIINEDNLDYPHSDSGYTEHHYGIEDHFDGMMNRHLGLIRCHEGASVVFPNVLQHKVKDFALLPGTNFSLRTILAFFVIDPKHRIVSTQDIPPQQGIMTLEQAQYHRERLMFHRKYYVKQFNEEVFERPFSLCEH